MKKQLFLSLCYLWAGLATAQDVQKTKDVEAYIDRLRNAQELLDSLDSMRSRSRDLPVLKTNEVEIKLGVHFALNSARLTPSDKHQLDLLAQTLQSEKIINMKVELAGHTCDLGSRKVNQELSERRVAAVADYLIREKSIAADRISTMAYGEDLPLVPNAGSEELRKYNRRVTLYPPDYRNTIQAILRQDLFIKGFRLAVLKYPKGQEEPELVHYDGTDILTSQDYYRVYAQPTAKRYLYIYQKDSQGNGHLIFPNSDSPYKNPLNPDMYYFPGDKTAFYLDNNKGFEEIRFLITEDPVPELEGLPAKVASTVFEENMKEVIAMRSIDQVAIVSGKTGAGDADWVQIDTKGSVGSKAGSGIQARPINIIMQNSASVLSSLANFTFTIKFKHE